MTTMEQEIKKLQTLYATSKRGVSFSSKHFNQRKPKGKQPIATTAQNTRKLKLKIH